MVNYYYRSKEQLFMKVLDGCLQDLLERVKLLMRSDGDFVEPAVGSADVLFDCFLAKKRLPFLLLDIARTHPAFLEHYREAFRTVCEESIKRHSAYLEQQIPGAGISAQKTINKSAHIPYNFLQSMVCRHNIYCTFATHY